MRIESNVGMVKGNKKAHNYAEHLKFRTGINLFLWNQEMQKV